MNTPCLTCKACFVLIIYKNKVIFSKQPSTLREINFLFMENAEETNQTDSALLPFLRFVGEKEIDDALSDLLIRHIQPTIEKTIRAKLRVSLKPTDFNQTNQDALELLSEVKLLLVSELGKLKSNHTVKTIQNLHSYVISVTINAYRQYLRKKYPQRQQLKNKLRYLLTHHPKFALWENEQGVICSFREKRQAFAPPNAETIQKNIAEIVNLRNLHDSGRMIDLLKVIFEAAKSPICFNDLLTIVAETQGIKDRREISETEISNRSDAVVSTKSDILSKIEQREILTGVWREIVALPVRHRLALLLNLKDKQGDCLIRLFPLLRIASIRQIAETLEFAPEVFAVVWSELPWDDQKISEYLGLTRQQVINLRQSARLRLIRQMK